MKNYLKLVLSVCLAIGLAIAFAGCSSSPIVYDKSVPTEESSILRITNCAVTEFNGIKLGAQWNSPLGVKLVQIPAGRHSLQVYQKGGGYGYETWNTVDLTYTFLPGHTYLVFLGTVDMGADLVLFDITLTEAEPKSDLSSPVATQFEGMWINEKDNQQWMFFGNEFVTINKGNYVLRGKFSFKSGNIQASATHTYNKGKWDLLAVPLKVLNASYSDNSITAGKYIQLKKVD